MTADLRRTGKNDQRGRGSADSLEPDMDGRELGSCHCRCLVSLLVGSWKRGEEREEDERVWWIHFAKLQKSDLYLIC